MPAAEQWPGEGAHRQLADRDEECLATGRRGGQLDRFDQTGLVGRGTDRVVVVASREFPGAATRRTESRLHRRPRESRDITQGAQSESFQPSTGLWWQRQPADRCAGKEQRDLISGDDPTPSGSRSSSRDPSRELSRGDSNAWSKHRWHRHQEPRRRRMGWAKTALQPVKIDIAAAETSWIRLNGRTQRFERRHDPLQPRRIAEGIGGNDHRFWTEGDGFANGHARPHATRGCLGGAVGDQGSTTSRRAKDKGHPIKLRVIENLDP